MKTTEQQTLDSVTEKIKKILRLAEGGNEHESNVAMSKAQKLAATYDINLSLVNSWETIEKEVYENDSLIDDDNSRLPITFNYIAWILNAHFKVNLVIIGGRKVNVIGLTSDVEIASYVWEYLNRTFSLLWKNYKNKNGAKTSARSSYFYGLYKGLDEKLNEASREAADEIFAGIETNKGYDVKIASQSKYQLAVVNNKKKLEDAKFSFFPNCSKRSKRTTIRTNDTDALQSGRSDGRKISLNRGVTHGQSRQLGC